MRVVVVARVALAVMVLVMAMMLLLMAGVIAPLSSIHRRHKGQRTNTMGTTRRARKEFLAASSQGDEAPVVDTTAS
jgi:hypothetical protein